MRLSPLLLAALAAATLPPSIARADPAPAGQPAASAVAKLAAMRKAADDLDESKDPAAYRTAWDAALAFAGTLYPEGHPERALTESELVTADFLQGDVRGALTRTNRLVAVLEAAGPAYQRQATDLLNGRMVILMTLGDHREARILGERLVAERRAEYAGKPSNEVAAAYSNLANAEFEFGNYDRAIELVRAAITEARRLDPMPPNAAVWFANLPVYLGQAGQTEEAIEAARSNAAVFEKLLGPAHPLLASNLNTLARLQLQLGRPAEAEISTRRAVDIAVAKFGEGQQTSSYLTMLSDALLQQGKTAEARAIADRAVANLTRDLGPDADRTLAAREAQARALAAAGDRDDATALLTAIAATREARLPPYHRDRIGGLDRTASLALTTGALTPAYDAQVAAQKLRRDTNRDDSVEQIVGQARLAAIAARQNGLYAQSLAAGAAARADTYLARLQATGSVWTGRDREARDAYGWALDAALSQDDAAAAFIFAQKFMANATTAAVRERSARQAIADPALAAAVRQRQDLAKALQRALDRQLRLAGRGAPAEEIAAVAAERQRLERELDAATVALSAKAPALLASELPLPLTLAAAQKALGRDEALLIAAMGPQRTGLILITRDKAVVAPVASDNAALTRLVRQLRTGLDPDSGDAPFDLASARRLHALLFPPAIARAKLGKPRLLIAANGPLAALPFATLVGSGTNLADARWLIRDHALVQLPSIAALADPRQARQQSSSGEFAAIGAPLLADATGTTGTRSAGTARQVAELARLPAADAELRDIALALSARAPLLLTGAGATERAVMASDLSRTSIIAFATHGLIAGELDGLDEPALVLTPEGQDDGLFKASEIMDLRLDADWVILSACNTAAGMGRDDDGLSGLGRAFFHAGARNLLASHWAVRDDAAATLTVGTMREYSRGTDAAEALRRTMLAMLSGNAGDRAQPRHWAPFVYIGR